MNIYVKGKKIRLDPSQSIGKGGEAELYQIDDHQVLKVFKQPNHPDYQNSPIAQQAARDRLSEHQQKLPQFPRNLPPLVIPPDTLATDAKGQTILGYTMPLVKDAVVLMKYSDRNFRNQGISHQTVVQIFQDLHTTISQIHEVQVVLGDFNDLNILINQNQAYLIDADSFQYGGYLCRVFTARFVDPLLCHPQQSKPVLHQPYSANSDWYAFGVMLMQCLLFVDPYGGVYRPKNPSQKILHDARFLHRITIFNPEVKYPKPALPYQLLPDELIHYFYQVFVQDVRGKFPRSLLEQLIWTKCVNCHLEHARPTCPNCTLATPVPTLIVTKVRGTVTATRIFETAGIILYAVVQTGKLQWIYHDQGEFKREDNLTIFSGELDPQLKFRIKHKTTLIGKREQLITLIPDQTPQRLVVESFDVNEDYRYWTYGGQLLRDGQLGPEYIGDVLAHQTQFWVGSHFGFGFYHAGYLHIFFVFNSKKRGINDQVKLPTWTGQLLNSTCTFTPERCWFFWSTQEQGKTIHRCAVIRFDGIVEATSQSELGDGSWLGNSNFHLSSNGTCAVGNFLLVATDDGIIRVEIQHDQIIQTKAFTDTEPLVDSSCQLFSSSTGLYVVNQREILLLEIK